MKLRTYQNEGIEFLGDRKYALLADDPGLGKTVQAIRATQCILAKRILIICPAQVKYNWVKEFEKWAPDHYTHHIINKSTEKVPTNKSVLIVNYDLVIREKLFRQLSLMRFDVIICDESHRLKNPKSQRSKKILGKNSLIPTTKRMWFLTGTPITNRPIDLFPLVARCMNAEFKPHSTYMGFAYRYCGAYKGRFGLVVTGATHLTELRDKLSKFMIRRKKGDVLKELPKRIIHRIEFECTPDIAATISREEDITVEMAGDRDPEHFKMGEISRIRRAVAKHKLKDSVGFIEDRLEEDKVVVFFYHKEVKKYLVEKFKAYDPLVIDGSVSAKERSKRVDAFMTKAHHRIFLGQMEAAGEGIDGLQHASSTCIFVEPSWLPKDMDQCISRLERMGQENHVNAYILTIKDTIEAEMMKLLEWKLANINVILNDNQSLKQGETKMAEKKKVVKKMYLEDKIDAILEVQQQLARVVTSLCGQLEKLANPLVAVNQAATSTVAPEPEEVEEVEEVAVADPIEIDAEGVRSLAAKITKADKVNGKNVCVEIIEKVAGDGKKLKDCDDKQLFTIAEMFSEVLSV